MLKGFFCKFLAIIVHLIINFGPLGFFVSLTLNDNYL